jgi:hypothetical protein
MKIVNKVILSAIALGCSSVVNAGMITEWSYVNEAGFTIADPGAVSKSGFVDAGDSILTEDTWKKLSWGDALTADGKSSLEIETPVTGTIVTAGVGQTLEESDFADGTDITHNNFRIGGLSVNHLTGATLLDGLKLTASAWDVLGDLSGVEGVAPELEISFDFLETPNRPAGQCVDGSTPGTDSDNLFPDEKFGCDDYFILNPLAGIDLIVDDNGDADPTNDYIQFTTVFNLLDLGFPEAVAAALGLVTKYEVVTRLTGLTVTTEFCGDQNAPCVGFATEELEKNVLQASFAIRAVPAPAGIAILGLGLLGLALNSRKRRSVKV